MPKFKLQRLLNAGIKNTDAGTKARAIRLSNLITFTAVFNGVVCALIFWYLNDSLLIKASAFAAALWSGTYILTAIGFTKLGRAFCLISGNLIVFWFACQFRGESLLQLFFFSLSVAPFMFFSWEERPWHLIALLSAFFLIIGEVNSYNFFTVSERSYDMLGVRIFAILAPLNQIMAGFFYFLKQSTKYEKENNENLKKLEIEYQKQLQVQKMSSLGEMASGVAHEINNPLMIIMTRVGMIKDSLKSSIPASDPAFEGLDKITATVNRIAKIIKALRHFSRNATDDPSERIAVRSVIDETLELCHERFNSAGISLNVVGEDNLKISCRPTEISQVLLNLLNNAYDAVAGQKGACVEIRSKNVDSGKVEIIVEDSGNGIPDAIADKIFHPFFTTKEVGKGTGLGLSISKGIVESHNGRISLIPNTGKTTFQIHLPAI